MLSLIAAVVFASPSVPRELFDYLKKPDSSVSWKVLREDRGQTEIELTSQTWQGTVWKHGILVQQPPKIEFKGTGVLFITGDGPRDGDRTQIRLLSTATGMPVAMLFDIPNQPLWNMREDDLIAHTFEKFLETRDATWPLLFPMTKSALRAMDAVQAVTRGSSNPLKRFVVTGASKRGWTTWLVGATGDKRIAGIAPMVYDNLNVGPQMKHQIEAWGEYSPMIQDYTRRGLQQKLNTPEGQKLAAMVDPYSYRDRIKMPTLIVTGGNDPYWASDAMSLYWNDLKQPKWARVIPNVSHDLGGGIVAIETIGMFARSLAGAFKMPTVGWEPVAGGFKLASKGSKLEKVTLWAAESKGDQKFGDKKWEPRKVVTAEELAASSTVAFPFTKGMNTAVFAEFRFDQDGRRFSVTTPTTVIKAN